MPRLSNDPFWNPSSPLNDKAVLEALVLERVGQLGVDGNLVINDTIQATVVLFQSNDSILEYPVRLHVPDA